MKLLLIGLAAAGVLTFPAIGAPQQKTDQELPEIEYVGAQFVVIRARAVWEHSTFYAETRNTFDTLVTEETIWQKAQTGSRPLRRVEVRRQGTLLSIVLGNDDGVFNLFGNNAVSNPSMEGYLQAVPPPRPIVRHKKIDADTYSFGDEIIRRAEDPKRFALAEMIYEKFKNGIPEGSKDPNYQYKIITYLGQPCYLIRRYNTSTRSYSDYIINQERYFPYVQRHYTREGRLQWEIQCLKVDFNPSFKASMFELPKDTHVAIAQDVDHHNRLAAEAIDAKIDAAHKEKLARIQAAQKRSRILPEIGNFLLRHGGKIFGSIGALAIALLIGRHFVQQKGKN